jgi:hypothetical protein
MQGISSRVTVVRFRFQFRFFGTVPYGLAPVLPRTQPEPNRTGTVSEFSSEANSGLSSNFKPILALNGFVNFLITPNSLFSVRMY